MGTGVASAGMVAPDKFWAVTVTVNEAPAYCVGKMLLMVSAARSRRGPSPARSPR